MSENSIDREGTQRKAAVDNGLRPTGFGRHIRLSLWGQESLVEVPRVESPDSLELETALSEEADRDV